jgi:hypothetical protein
LLGASLISTLTKQSTNMKCPLAPIPHAYTRDVRLRETRHETRHETRSTNGQNDSHRKVRLNIVMCTPLGFTSGSSLCASYPCVPIDPNQWINPTNTAHDTAPPHSTVRNHVSHAHAHTQSASVHQNYLIVRMPSALEQAVEAWPTVAYHGGSRGCARRGSGRNRDLKGQLPGGAGGVRRGGAC